jgi:hypothetical protein
MAFLAIRTGVRSLTNYSKGANPIGLKNAGMTETEQATKLLKTYTFAVQKFRDVAQPGSALRSGRRGRWFESSHPDFIFFWKGDGCT